MKFAVSLHSCVHCMCCSIQPGEHPAGAQGLWGTGNEVPSFLYGMPLGNGRIFLEETCLVSKPGLPFATLKRRLERRLDAMGIKVGPCWLVVITCPSPSVTTADLIQSLVDGRKMHSVVSWQANLQTFWQNEPARCRAIRFGSTAKVLAKCMLKYYRISECAASS